MGRPVRPIDSRTLPTKLTTRCLNLSCLHLLVRLVRILDRRDSSVTHGKHVEERERGVEDHWSSASLHPPSATCERKQLRKDASQTVISQPVEGPDLALCDCAPAVGPLSNVSEKPFQLPRCWRVSTRSPISHNDSFSRNISSEQT